MEVRKPKEWESFLELREIKKTQETKEQKEGFSMMKGGKGYTIADIEALSEGERAELIDGELFWMGAPDWMIEIVSPSSKKMDCERKVALYREAGAREYWIVDAETEIVTVYDFENDKKEHGENGKASDAVCGFMPVQYSFSERIKVGIFEDLWLCLAEMDIS